MFLWTYQEESLSQLIPTGSTAHAMHQRILAVRQMVMNNILDMGNIQTARSQVCGYQHRSRTIGELIQGIFTLALFQATMKSTGDESLLAQILVSTLHGVAIIQKDDALRIAQCLQQAGKSIKFIFLRTIHTIHLHPIIQWLLVYKIIQTVCATHLHELWNLFRISCRE